jgi:hypothetical protein
MRSKILYPVSLIMLFSLLLSSTAIPGVQAHEPNPDPLLLSAPDGVSELATAHVQVAEDVSSFDSSADPVLYWVTQPANCSNGAAATFIMRTRITGWEPRRVYSNLPGQFDPCPYKILSNVVSDETFIYWVDQAGLQRLPKDAGLFDAPLLLLPQLSGGGQHDLIIDEGRLYGLHLRPLLVGTFSLWSMALDDPASYAPIVTENGGASNLRWDGTYLYTIAGSSNELRRYNTSDGSHLLIAYEVTSYVPAGRVYFCAFSNCNYYDFTYFVDNYHPNRLNRFNAETSEIITMYTATPQPGNNVTLNDLELGGYTGFNLLDRDVLFFERQEAPGDDLAIDSLMRMIPEKEPFAVHVRSGDSAYGPEGLQTSEDFMLWKEITTPNANSYGDVFRLPLDAEALPVVNLRITGYELTQGVQPGTGTFFYVQRRPTFLRLFVKSDGLDVPNVTARLTGYSGGFSLGTILPAPLLITVPEMVVKTNLERQFVFELPLDWTTKSDLTLLPSLNPFKFPLEPTYSDNAPAKAYGPFAFLPQPGLHLTLVSAGINVSGITVMSADEDAILSWLYRAYPTGLGAVERWEYTDDELSRRVLNYKSYGPCQYLDRTSDGGNDNRNLCASYYLNERMTALQLAGRLRKDTYIYTSIPYLPRGSAHPTAPVANGPNLLLRGFTFEQAGYYAGHEIGHLLGREHPVPGSAACGHSASDPDYPYTSTWIGNFSNQTTAFDSGLLTPGRNRVANRYFERTDVMGYCNTRQQWLSDYTYRGIYLYARQFPGPQVQSPAQLNTADVDDWLTVAGNIAADGSAAGFSSLLRTSSMAETPSQIPGDYSLRLLDAGGATLADNAFTPMLSSEVDDWMNFVETVPFAAGTRRVQLIANDGSLLVEQVVSANPPVVSNVSLPGASSPLDGTVTLVWQASDPDGDTLSYDVLYSANEGRFRLLASGLSSSSYTFDTAELSGGDGVFQVVASDGVNTAQADSASLPVVMKAPQVHILSPVEGQQIQYGQPLNLVGYGQDPQDGMMEDVSNLLWSGPDGPIDVGPVVGMTEVEVAGTVTITLQATNSMGISAEASVQVVVGDELGDPPPSLYVDTAGVAMQAPNGDSSPQSAVVGIWKGGGLGEVSWDASMSPAVDWLQADMLSGTAPYTLTLSADPTGLAADTIFTTILTISSSDGQTVALPVSLQTGAGFVVDGITDPNSEPKIYLPMLFKR